MRLIFFICWRGHIVLDVCYYYSSLSLYLLQQNSNANCDKFIPYNILLKLQNRVSKTTKYNMSVTLNYMLFLSCCVDTALHIISCLMK